MASIDGGGDTFTSTLLSSKGGFTRNTLILTIDETIRDILESWVCLVDTLYVLELCATFTFTAFRIVSDQGDLAVGNSRLSTFTLSGQA